MNRVASLMIGLPLLVGCADPAPAAAPPQGAAVLAPAAPEPAAKPPRAVVKGVGDGKGSEPTRRVEFEIENTGAATCAVSAYTVTWPGGKKKFALDKVVVKPGEHPTRFAKLNGSDGDITLARDAGDVVIELESSCK